MFHWSKYARSAAGAAGPSVATKEAGKRGTAAFASIRRNPNALSHGSLEGWNNLKPAHIQGLKSGYSNPALHRQGMQRSAEMHLGMPTSGSPWGNGLSMPVNFRKPDYSRVTKDKSFRKLL